MKKWIVLIFLLFAVNAYPGQLIVGQGGMGTSGGEACSFSAQDLDTDYSETDPGTDITLNDTTASWTTLINDAQSMVVRNFTADYFSGDFTVRFEFTLSSDSVGWSGVILWGVANEATGFKPIDNGTDESDDAIIIKFYNDDNGAIPTIQLKIAEDGDFTTLTDLWTGPTDDTKYYVTVTRNDDGGTNGTGQITAVFRTTSHAGAVQDTLTLDCSASEQNDFQYMYVLDSWNNGTSYHTTGSTENFEEKQCID